VKVIRQGGVFRDQREAMVQSQLIARGILDQRVLQTMRQVPRHEFLDPRYQSRAYEDCPLPIAMEQTISQPYIVAFMLEALELQKRHRVLEVGTGSGYTAALLAELAGEVYSIERHEQLAVRARETLADLGYDAVKLMVGDGCLGWPTAAPFDAILVSAAAQQIPPALPEQLTEGGRLIIPVGPPYVQELQLVVKREGRLSIAVLEGCRFVPLISSAEMLAEGTP
jgi:protein-L-isoaspartate(D-aspartate) O-methyltransferase